MDGEAQFLLSRPADVADDAFRAALRKAAEIARRHDLFAGAAVLSPSEALHGLPHAVETVGSRASDAILTLGGRRSDLIVATVQIASILCEVADEASSALIGGMRHAILPGRNRAILSFGLRRLERMSRAEFQDYWLNSHADQGRRLIPARFGYHQLHTDADFTDCLSRAAGWPAATFDGVAEMHCPTLAAMITQLQRADVAIEAIADERNFIDHNRSVFGIYEQLGD